MVSTHLRLYFNSPPFADCKGPADRFHPPDMHLVKSESQIRADRSKTRDYVELIDFCTKDGRMVDHRVHSGGAMTELYSGRGV